jgi:hypothetical protein
MSAAGKATEGMGGGAKDPSTSIALSTTSMAEISPLHMLTLNED